MDSILSVNPAWYIVIPIILFLAIICCCCCKLREPKQRALHREQVSRVIGNVTSNSSGSSNNRQQHNRQSPLDVFVIDVDSFTMEPFPYSPSAVPPVYFNNNVNIDDLPPTYEQALNDKSQDDNTTLC